MRRRRLRNITTKNASVVIVYIGEGKSKTSAGLGLVYRALGAGKSVAFIQFIKRWHVSEDTFLESISDLYDEKLIHHKGGLGIYNAGDMSASKASKAEHVAAATATYQYAMSCSQSGRYDVVVCDEINNAVHDDLLSEDQLKELITKRHKTTSLCLTGRNFPDKLLICADIVSNMTKLKHHYDEGVIASVGIDH